MIKSRFLRIGLLFLITFLTTAILLGCTSKEVETTSEPVKETPDPGTEVKGESEWPTEPVTILVPLDPGGGVDVMARGITNYLPKHLGVPVVVENIGGGLSIPGMMEYVSNRPDDGSTLLATWQTVLSDRYINHGAKYTIDDFSYINIHQTDPVSIITPKDSPWNTLEELINDMKARPGEIPVGYLSGAASQIAAQNFMDALGLEPRYVAFDGGSEFRLAVAGGDVAVGFGHSIGDYSFEEDLKMLAIYSKESFELWPEVPLINDTLKPFGVELNANLASTRMLAVHSSFQEKYPDRWEKLLDAYQNMLNDEEYKAHLEESGEDVATRWLGPDESLKVTKEMDELVLRYSEKAK
ncbi:tripartite tricarboxylate transporter substrate binding protein [Bacillus sp. Marseille-P3661]|uniref:tripartite tricarboxylate transporter substrate binding protein n=1 Tax=Bacillus sp. Marseille-P3661 TaxID=1936234 RepID=UPI000C8346E4|nr:tripartite tricarboxylate transporter substrate binding protein [Bacillus sp. Marseille-P3661]